MKPVFLPRSWGLLPHLWLPLLGEVPLRKGCCGQPSMSAWAKSGPSLRKFPKALRAIGRRRSISYVGAA